MSLEKVHAVLGSLDINEGDTYAIQSISMPPPPLRKVYGGDNIHRDGSSFIEKKYQNRTITITLAIRADSYSGLNDAIRNLYEEAVEDTNTFEYRPLGTDTPNNLTFDILGPSTVDVPTSEDGMWAQYMVEGAVLTMTAKPFARGAEVTLNNLCKNASFQQDTDGDGTPDYWSAYGSVTLSRSTAYRKYGIRSLHIVGAAENDGMQSDTISISSDTTYALSFWYWVREGGLEVRVQGDSSGALISETSVSDPKWNRKTLTFTTGAGDSTVFIEFRQLDATNVDAFVDGVYVGEHDSVPDGWCGYYNLTNHTDDDAGDVSYFDVADIPGDVPAGIIFGIDDDVNKARTMRWAMKDHDRAFLFPGVYEAEDEPDISGQLSKQSDASASGGYAVRYTAGTATEINLWIMQNNMSESDLDLYKGTYNVFVRHKVNGNDVDFGMKTRLFCSTFDSGWNDEVTDLSMGSYGLVDLGTIDIPPSDTPDGWGIYNVRLDINLRSITGNNTLDVDYVWLVPTDTLGIAEFTGYTLSAYHSMDTIADPPLVVSLDPAQFTNYTIAQPLSGLRYTGHYHYPNPNSQARFFINADRRKFLDYDNEDDRDFYKELYGSASTEQLAQGIKADVAISPEVIWLYLKKTGSPTDNMTLEIQGNSGGTPDGSPIDANATSDTVAMSGVDDDWEWVAFQFSGTAPSLSSGTQYHLVLKSDQASADSSNYIAWACDLSGSYSDGNVAWYDGSSWTAKTARDYLFKADIMYNKLDEDYDVYFRYEPRYLLVP